MYAYEYAVLRVVPRVEREEFVNVGVILYCKGMKYLNVKYHLDKERLLAFYQKIDIPLLEQYLRVWDWICLGKEEGGVIAQLDIASRFRWLTASRSTIIQSSQVHPGQCLEPERILQKLFEQYVV